MEDKKKPNQFRSLVPAVDQAIRVLLFMQEKAGVKLSLTKICQAVGINASKGHYILSTLQAYGFVEKDPDSKMYVLGARLITLARSVLDHLDYRATAGPIVEALAKETRSTVWFGIRINDFLSIVNKHEGGEHFWATPGIGQTFNVFEGAHGKVVLAFLSEEERTRVVSLDKGAGGVKEEIALTRRMGFSKDLGEFAKGINAVAAPVFGPASQLTGVLLLFGTFPEEQIEIYGRKIADSAKQLSQKLGS